MCLGLNETTANNMGTLSTPALVRRLQIERFERHDHVLSLFTSHIAQPLFIPFYQTMTFGTETISAIDYFRQVIESGDLIDAVIHPEHDGAFPISIYWIHIQYVGTRQEAGTFSKKDDGLFAMWTKGGEKAERVVARHLRDHFGHSFPDTNYASPGFFEIRYAGKKVREPDMKCVVCGITLEVKKRNRDKHFRVSHSIGRPFSKENSLDDWHAFVFADMKPRFIPNSEIVRAIVEGRFRPGANEYDKWADIDGVKPATPPHCIAKSP